MNELSGWLEDKLISWKGCLPKKIENPRIAQSLMHGHAAAMDYFQHKMTNEIFALHLALDPWMHGYNPSITENVLFQTAKAMWADSKNFFWIGRRNQQLCSNEMFRKVTMRHVVQEGPDNEYFAAFKTKVFLRFTVDNGSQKQVVYVPEWLTGPRPESVYGINSH